MANSIKYSTFIKMAKALKYLAEPFGIKKKSLALELGIAETTVYDWKNRIEELLHCTVKSHIINGEAWFSIDPSCLTQIRVPKNFEWDEAVVLGYLLQNTPQFFPPSFQHVIERLKLKILGDKTAALESLFYVSPKGSVHSDILADPNNETMVEDLFCAIDERRVCNIRYQNRNREEKTYTINPLHLIEKDGRLYLLADVPAYGMKRSFRPDFIHSLEVRDQIFEYPSNFNIADYVESAWGTFFGDPLHIKVHIKPEAAESVIKKHFTKDQHIKIEEDGAVILEANTSGRIDVLNWVLSLGSAITVLEPPELIELVKAEYTKALAQY
jgi:predicted DNA-binding transcriptional regulator YafY